MNLLTICLLGLTFFMRPYGSKHEFITTNLSLCRRVKNLTGFKGPHFSITSFAGLTEDRAAYWNCECKCGKLFVILAGNRRKQESCGCVAHQNVIKAATTHGMTNSSEYNIWKGICKRCRLKSDPAYYKYGGRGIDVCDRWFDSFQNFYADMGPRPKGMSIDRIDNDKGYSLDNCRWATYTAQSRNKRSNHLIEYNGKKMCITEWSEKTGIRKDTLRRRLVNYKWPVEKALTTPVNREEDWV